MKHTLEIVSYYNMPRWEGLVIISYTSDQSIYRLDIFFTVKPAGCPDGWQSTPDGLRCFGLMFDRKSWKQARAACKTYGAELASIQSRYPLLCS